MSVSSDQQVENLKKEAIAELEAYILVQFELQQNIRASDLKSIYRQFVFKHPGLELPEQEEMIKKVNEKLMQEKGYKANQIQDFIIYSDTNILKNTSD